MSELNSTLISGILVVSGSVVVGGKQEKDEVEDN